MALVIDLKPNERVVIGQAVVRNDKNRARLYIEGDTPILREKDIITEDAADTPCKKIYFAIQLMYLSTTPEDLHATYFELIKDVQDAAPSTIPLITLINEHLLMNHYYKALKTAQDLINYETDLMAGNTA